MMKKRVVKVGKRGSEIILFPLKHTRYIKKRVWKNAHEVLGELPRSIKAIATEGVTVVEKAKPNRKINATMTQIYLKETSFFPMECKKRGIDHVNVDSAMLKGKKERPDVINFYEKVLEQKLTRRDKRSIKFSRKFFPRGHGQEAEASNEYRNVIMASNLLKAVKWYEKREKKPIKMAFIAHPSHTGGIGKLLEHPEFPLLEKHVFKATKGEFMGLVWQGPVIQKPRNIYFMNREEYKSLQEALKSKEKNKRRLK